MDLTLAVLKPTTKPPTLIPCLYHDSDDTVPTLLLTGQISMNFTNFGQLQCFVETSRSNLINFMKTKWKIKS